MMLLLTVPITQINTLSTQDLDNALAQILPSGSTSIGNGLSVALNMLHNDGNNNRKAILLLTDGKENSPLCLDSSGNTNCTGDQIPHSDFEDVHICAIGYGETYNLDSAVLRDLVERQSGIFTAFTDVNSLASVDNLNKYFLQCYADIFDDNMALDPLGKISSNNSFSEPHVVNISYDNEATFVLTWIHPKTSLDLIIKTPLGQQVDFDDPNITYKVGNTWKIVKIPLPYNGEKIGAWTTYASKTYDHDRNEYDYSIDVTVKGFGNIVPFNPTFNTYTTDGGWAKLRIPESYRPSGNFDNVDVKVTVTSPNINTGNILRTTGLIAPTIFLNDTIDSRSRTLFEMEKTYINQNITLIPTITDTQMYDDGTYGMISRFEW